MKVEASIRAVERGIVIPAWAWRESSIAVPIRYALNKVQSSMFKVQGLKKRLLRLPGEGREPGINKYWMPVYTGMTDSGETLVHSS